MDTAAQTLGLWSIAPPLIAIILALWTRQVYLALAVGIWIGYLILAGGDPLTGTLDAIEAQVNILTDAGNARIVMFTFIMGALIALIQRSGGVEGFISRILDFLTKVGTKQADKGNRKVVESITAITGLVLFIESNVSILTVGTLYRPIFDKLGIPREKLAYITDSTCAPSCIMMPFNAWGAFIVGILTLEIAGSEALSSAGVQAPELFIKSLVYNFYPMLTVLLIFTVIWTGKDVGDMKKAEIRARDTGKLLRDGAVPMMDDSLSMLEAKPGIKYRASNMLVPILSMVVLVPIFLIYTGWADAEGVGFSRIWAALIGGSGSSSVLYAVSSAILIAILMYKAQGLLGIREMVELSIKGMSGMIGMAVLIVMAFALNSMCRELGTGQYMADVASGFITPALVPAIIFIIAGLIGFSTGTSWGTFAIMLAVAIPLSQSMAANPSLAIAAALGGGVFGDHCSPTSDTTVITSLATANDHIDHVRTQIPYALIAGTGTVILYLILGFAGV